MCVLGKHSIVIKKSKNPLTNPSLLPTILLLVINWGLVLEWDLSSRQSTFYRLLGVMIVCDFELFYTFLCDSEVTSVLFNHRQQDGNTTQGHHNS